MVRGRVVVACLAVVFGCAACASTTITSVVSPAAPKYGPHQILVVAAYADLTWRRDVETGFQARDSVFVASVNVLEVGSLNDANAIIRWVAADSTIEGLLLLGPSGSGLEQSFVATQYYAGTVSKPWANTAATLYDKAEAKIVWRADASTGGNAYASWSDIRNSFIGKIVERLDDDGLLTDRPLVRQPSRIAQKPQKAAVTSLPANWRRVLPAEGEILTLTPTDLMPRRTGTVFERIGPAVVTLMGDRGQGSAFLISRDGLALTNAHVVEGQNTLYARFSGGAELPVRIVRTNAEADVALIQVACDSDCLTSPLASSADVPVGTEVYAIGAPLGLDQTVTRGIVSAVRLTRGVTLLQTDAAINPGNSGGPLVDARTGQVVGIVSSKIVGNEVQGIGFGISITDALRILGLRS